MVKLQVIIGSTRPNRVGAGVGEWVNEVASKRDDIEVELVDIADFNLPLFDEPMSPSVGRPTLPHTKKWAEKIGEADGYIFIVAEYNHSVTGALKNAIDFLNREWNNKAAGFVSYGASASGTRAVEHLRTILGEVQVADVREQLPLSLIRDFEGFTKFQPTETHEQQLHKVINQVAAWATALKPVRKQAADVS